MTRVQIAIYVLLGAALTVSVVTDFRARRILDLVTYPTLTLCLALRLATGGFGTAMGPGLTSGLLAAVMAGALFLILHRMDGMGLGDVKLMATVGAGVGFPTILACLVFIGIAGGIEAIAVLIWKGRLLRTLGGMGRSVLQAMRIARPLAEPCERIRIPYGVAIAAGTAWGIGWTLSQAVAVP